MDKLRGVAVRRLSNESVRQGHSGGASLRWLCAACIAGVFAMLPLSASQAQGDQELAAAAQNPVGNLISLPFQNNTLFGIGPNNEVVNVLNIQPVVPFELSDRWNLITRTIVPLVRIPGSVEGLDILPSTVANDTKLGIGDVNLTAFVSPRVPGRIIWGLGPSITFPTATDDVLGSEKLSLGPSIVLLAQPAPWSVGVLVRQLWSVVGEENRSDVNQTLIQPFVNYNFPSGWYLTTAPVITANWNAANSDDRWVVPFGGGFGKLFRVGRRPVNASLSAYNNFERPALGPEWSLRVQVQLLFPK